MAGMKNLDQVVRFRGWSSFYRSPGTNLDHVAPGRGWSRKVASWETNLDHPRPSTGVVEESRHLPAALTSQSGKVGGRATVGGDRAAATRRAPNHRRRSRAAAQRAAGAKPRAPYASFIPSNAACSP